MKIRCAIIVFFLACSGISFACSAAIISGRATPDGRPLLWKHRDAREEENDLRYFRGENFDFIGLANTQDTTGTQVWMGANTAGFSIINTNAYNLDKGKTYKGAMDLEGFLMKEALGRCATIADFERMLDETKGKRGALSNFGAMDAQGGAAFYETTPDTYEKFDVNDPKVAPAGYLIRTNFGFTGSSKSERGGGYVRYQTLEELFFWTSQKGGLSAEFLLIEATRCLRNSILKTDLYAGDLPENTARPTFILFRDYIVRDSSVSSMVIQGVRAGEDARLTTLWTIPAFQLTALTVPLWTAAGEALPDAVVSKDGHPAPMSERALRLKRKCFPLQVGEGKDYLDLGAILNKRGDGILQKILIEDKRNIGRANALLEKFRAEGFNKNEAAAFYRSINTGIGDFYTKQNNE